MSWGTRPSNIDHWRKWVCVCVAKQMQPTPPVRKWLILQCVSHEYMTPICVWYQMVWSLIALILSSQRTRTMSVLWNMCLTSCNGAGIAAVTVAGGFQMSRLYGLWGNCRKKGIQFCYHWLSSPFNTLNPASTTALCIGTWWARGPVSKRFALLPL
jgi:hypothetical protein